MDLKNQSEKLRTKLAQAQAEIAAETLPSTNKGTESNNNQTRTEPNNDTGQKIKQTQTTQRGKKGNRRRLLPPRISAAIISIKREALGHQPHAVPGEQT